MLPADTKTTFLDLGATEDKLQLAKTPDHPDIVLQNASKELKDFGGGKIDLGTPLFKAVTLYEFDNGLLLSMAVSDSYRTVVIDISNKLQKEYDCQTVSEKATCEIASVSYARILETQRRLNNLFLLEYTNENLVKLTAILSKELDRANRHYFTAIQTLRMMKQSPLNITIKAQTAIVGQNQIVQANSHE